MTMHLCHPSLSLNGKKKGKKKWASSEQKQKAEQLEKDWASLQTKWGVDTQKKKKQKPSLDAWKTPILVHRDSGSTKPKSLNTWITGAATTKQIPQYTGENIIGITIIHKSCLQPVFNKEQAKDAANMRR